jgi:osmotically-inducible protein OsmY
MKFTAVLLMIGCTIACRTNESPEAQVDDLQITTQVKAKLASDTGVSSLTNVSVNSTNGVVTLAGQVDSADVKAKALAIARTVPKVVRVVDNLQVVTKPTSSVRHLTPSCGPSIAHTSA